MAKLNWKLFETRKKLNKDKLDCAFYPAQKAGPIDMWVGAAFEVKVLYKDICRETKDKKSIPFKYLLDGLKRKGLGDLISRDKELKGLKKLMKNLGIRWVACDKTGRWELERWPIYSETFNIGKSHDKLLREVAKRKKIIQAATPL